jgi:hypothetical protein
MRSHHDVVELEQGPAVRLLRENVERCARDLAGAERRDERFLLDQLSTGDVHDANTVLGRRELLPPDEVLGLRGQREVERDEVGLCE